MEYLGGWTSISKLLMGNDPLIRHRVVSLVSSEYDDYLGPGFLYAVPPKIYTWSGRVRTQPVVPPS